MIVTLSLSKGGNQGRSPPASFRRRGSKQHQRSRYMESDKMLKIMGYGTLAVIVLGILLFIFKM
jgi:hypothetical protein